MVNLPYTSNRRKLCTLLGVALATLLPIAAQAADLPPAGLDISGWPRMTSPAFGCLLEKTLGHRDAHFNCSLTRAPAGDPCIDTDAYYAGPTVPPALATRVHPLARNVDVSFEHGAVQAVTVTLTGKFSESDVRRAFGLPASQGLPDNIIGVSVQACSQTSTCLLLTGFDHMGAGDVECPAGPPKRK